jgi:serine/threonine protein kinase
VLACPLRSVDVVMETIGSYRILSQLGAGGMGTVYLAEHRFLKRRSAIKVLLADLTRRPDLLERFFAEARATSLIEHPGIVRIFDCELDDQGRPYFVMELLEGETLAAYLGHRGRLAPSEAAGYALAIAEAMTAAHERGIIHRDLKPDNVFVRPGPPLGIKLVDFGIAKLAGEFRASGPAHTQTGMLLGTPPYMSPEQCRGAGTIDHRTDIYSLGCVLYEMLCGTPPFVRDSTGGFLVAHMTQAPPPANATNPEVSRALSDVVGALLRKAPEDRPRTMRDVAELLAPFAPPAPAPTTSASGAQPHLDVTAVPTASGPLDATAPQTPWRPLQTTLRSRAGEVSSAGDAAADQPRSRGRGLLLAATLVAILAASGWLGWRQFGPQLGPRSIAAGTALAEVPRPAPAALGETAHSAAGHTTLPGAPPPRASRSEPRLGGRGAKPRPAHAVVAGGTLAASPLGSDVPAENPASDSPAGRGFVVVDLDSNPTGAAICFEGDRRFITVTHGAVQLPFDHDPVTFLIDLAGHVPARITVKADRDARHVVHLQPLPEGQVGQPACQY